MYEKFTDRARKVMQLANQEAQRFNHRHIGTEHMLLGLIKEGSCVAAHVLKDLDIDLRKVRLEAETLMQMSPDAFVLGTKLPHSEHAKAAIPFAVDEARQLGHSYVGTEHLLLGMLRLPASTACRILTTLGVQLDMVRAEVLNLLGNAERDPRMQQLAGAVLQGKLTEIEMGYSGDAIGPMTSYSAVSGVSGAATRDIATMMESTLKAGAGVVLPAGPPPAPRWAREMAARAWCAPTTSGIVMVPALAEEFARQLKHVVDLAEVMHGVICNVSHGDLTKQDEQWQTAARRAIHEYNLLLSGAMSGRPEPAADAPDVVDGNTAH